MKYDECSTASFATSSQQGLSKSSRANEVPQQLTDLARQLAAIATDMLQQSDQNSEDPVAFAERFARGLRQIVRGRRIRNRIFPAVAFADPAWDILLDLTLARIEGNNISISSAAIGASVPTSTALRWLKHLMNSGMIERVNDPSDKRRIFIQVTNDTFAGMSEFARAFADPI
jgi:hypothetical protein